MTNSEKAWHFVLSHANVTYVIINCTVDKTMRYAAAVVTTGQEQPCRRRVRAHAMLHSRVFQNGSRNVHKLGGARGESVARCNDVSHRVALNSDW